MRKTLADKIERLRTSMRDLSQAQPADAEEIRDTAVMALQRLQVTDDERGFCRDAMKTILAVSAIEHTSLRNAVLEEIVGLLRRVNNPIFVSIDKVDQ